MTIIASIPNILTNGTTADATQVMADFSSIISQVNANGAALAGGNAFTGTQTIGGDTILTANANINGGNGTVTAPRYSFFASQSTGMWSPALNALGFTTNGVNAIYVDASQNVGLSVVPSAWFSSWKATQYPGMSVASSPIAAAMGQNWYINSGGADTYVGTASATLYEQTAGLHKWLIAASGTAGAAITFAQAMTLDAGGNLLVGTSTASLGTSGRGLLEINGSASALVNLKVGGTSSGYVFHDGSTLNLVNLLSGGALSLGVQIGPKLTIDSIGRTVLTGSAATTPSRLGNVSGAVTLNCALSNVHEITLTGNLTSLTLSNLSDGVTLNVFITQDGTGSRTLNGLTNANGYVWPSGVQGVLSTPAGSVDLLVMTYRASVGKLYCTLAKAFS